MVLRRLFGGGPSEPDPETTPVPRPPSADTNETETVRKIVNQLEALPVDQRRFVAGFAYVLGRAAHADLEFSDVEIAAIEKTVAEVGGLTRSRATKRRAALQAMRTLLARLRSQRTAAERRARADAG